LQLTSMYTPICDASPFSKRRKQDERQQA
jgi:hypothetical protein